MSIAGFLHVVEEMIPVLWRNRESLLLNDGKRHGSCGWYADEVRLGIQFPHPQKIVEDLFEPLAMFGRHHAGDGYQIHSCNINLDLALNFVADCQVAFLLDSTQLFDTYTET